MLEIDKVSLSFSAKTLLDKVSFTLFAKQKYGLIGKNGVGKTSLFHLITGKVKADGGDTKKFMAKAKDKNDSFRLMGFGHRVYKNFDPRAKIIKVAADEVRREYAV